jgi:hypothetical protein
MRKPYTLLDFILLPLEQWVKSSLVRNILLSRLLSRSVRRLTLVAAVALVALLAAEIGPAAPQLYTATASSTVQFSAIVQYRQYYNPTIGKHYYTRFTNTAPPGFQFERVVAFVFDGPGVGLVPFFHLRHPGTGDNFYTIDWNEVQSAIQNNGYVLAGDGSAYVYPPGQQGGGFRPLYRLYSPSGGDHFYTTSWEEVILVTQTLGYVYEGVACDTVAL